MIDTHCHLCDESFNNDIDVVLNNYFSSGGKEAVVVGCDYDEMQKTLNLVKKYEKLYCIFGIHPEVADEYDEDRLIKFLDNAKKINKLKAIGETGLDYYYNKDNKLKQLEVFEKQIILSKKYGLPIVIHCRDAYGDCLTMLQKHAPYKNGGVMHCFSGSYEFATEAIKLGFYISFSGSVTFKNARNLQAIAAALPLEKILSETDCPYLAPDGMRGKRNEPAFVGAVVKKIAELKKLPYVAVEKILEDNAKKLFKL